MSSGSMDHKRWLTAAALTAVYQHGLLQAAAWDHGGILRMPPAPPQKKRTVLWLGHPATAQSQGDWLHNTAKPAGSLDCCTPCCWPFSAVTCLLSTSATFAHCCCFRSSFFSLNHRRHSILPSFPSTAQSGIANCSVSHSIYPPNSFTCSTYCNKPLIWFKIAGFWNTINTRLSLRLIWDILLLPRVQMIFELVRVSRSRICENSGFAAYLFALGTGHPTQLLGTTIVLAAPWAAEKVAPCCRPGMLAWSCRQTEDQPNCNDMFLCVLQLHSNWVAASHRTALLHRLFLQYHETTFQMHLPIGPGLFICSNNTACSADSPSSVASPLESPALCFLC